MKKTWRTLALTLTALALAAPPAEAQIMGEFDDERMVGDYTLVVQDDAMTDQTQYVVATMSLPNPREGGATLGIICAPGASGVSSMASFMFPGFSVDDATTILVRFDEDEPDALTWSVEQRGVNTMVYTTSRSTVDELAANLAAAHRLRVRGPDNDDFEFSTNGATAAFRQVPCVDV